MGGGRKGSLRQSVNRLTIMNDFDAIIERFRNKELNVSQWNFCIHREGEGKFGAYIMGEGAEQCLTRKHGFNSEQEIKDLYHSLGVTRHILPI